VHIDSPLSIILTNNNYYDGDGADLDYHMSNLC
jgi:hypothetical protein